MGIVINKDFIGNKIDNKTHKIIPFTIDKNIEEFTIYFSFDPYLVKDKNDLLEAFENGIHNGDITLSEIRQKIEDGTCHLNNMISISLYKGNKFMGCSHKHNKNQVHKINKVESSHGFMKIENLIGDYEAIISFHGIFTDGMELNFKVEYNE